GDTFNFIRYLERIGEDSWFKLGDKDLSFCFLRTYLLRKGFRLSEACKFICDILNVRVSIFPASNQSIQTRILTEKGGMHFQEWWVREKGSLKVLNIDFKGAEIAKSAPGVLEAINCAEKIVIGPSNPVTSIGPILAVKEIREVLEKTKAKVVAVSPIIGDSPLSGPAGTFMQFLNLEVSPLGVAKVYQSFLDCLIIDERDKNMVKRIEKELGIEVVSVNTIMKTLDDKKELAETVLKV
ncbi:MAG: 2-phospho-L-lactate transferase CofD family protein, partial [Asgard group archaeon]